MFLGRTKLTEESLSQIPKWSTSFRNINIISTAIDKEAVKLDLPVLWCADVSEQREQRTEAVNGFGWGGSHNYLILRSVLAMYIFLGSFSCGLALDDSKSPRQAIFYLLLYCSPKDQKSSTSSWDFLALTVLQLAILPALGVQPVWSFDVVRMPVLN